MSLEEKLNEILEEILKNNKIEERMGVKDENVNTNLISKNYSPMIVRKYNIINGWPLYLGIICDQSLNDLDKLISFCFNFFKNKNLITNNIQDIRNVAGVLSDAIVKYYNDIKYGCVEGIGIVLYVDKMTVSSLYGDMMNCHLVRNEFYSIIQIMTQI